jgi:hypothetical protein
MVVTTERLNSERTDCGPVNQSKRRLVHPGSNATLYQLRFYENEYQYRSVLVRREACDADPALLGTKATFTRRASSGRGRPLAVRRGGSGYSRGLGPASAKRCARFRKTSSHHMFGNILRADQVNFSGGSSVLTTNTAIGTIICSKKSLLS